MKTCKLYTFLLFCFFSCFPMTQVDGVDFSKNQAGRLVSAVAGTAFSFLADSINLNNVKSAKKAALLKMVGHIFETGPKVFDDSGCYGEISKELHANKLLWRVVKGLEELEGLSGIQKEQDEDIGSSSLEKYYPNYDFKNGEGDFFKALDEEGGSSFKKTTAKPLLRLLKLGLLAGIISGKGTQKQKGMMIIGESVCELLLRFWCNDQEFASPSWIGLIEAASSVAAPGYDIGQAARSMMKKQKLKKEQGVDAVGKQMPGWNDVCKGCNKPFSEENGSVWQMGKCGHWCCQSCAKAREKELVEVFYERKHGAAGWVEDLDPRGLTEGQKKLYRVERPFKVVHTCPICNHGGQIARPDHIPNPNPVEEVEDESFLCPICKEHTKENTAGTCGHVLCRGCYSGLYFYKGNDQFPKCPECSKPFEPIN